MCGAGFGSSPSAGALRREHLTTATTMYREMGTTYWLEQAEAEMRALAAQG